MFPAKACMFLLICCPGLMAASTMIDMCEVTISQNRQVRHDAQFGSQGGIRTGRQATCKTPYYTSSHLFKKLPAWSLAITTPSFTKNLKSSCCLPNLEQAAPNILSIVLDLSMLKSAGLCPGKFTVICNRSSWLRRPQCSQSRK